MSRQRAESIHEANLAQKTYYERTALIARFAEEAELTIRRRAVPRRVAAWRQADALVTEERKDRLRALMDEDTALWRAELLAMDPTPQSRVVEMRKRVAELKAKREEERQRIVADKLEEHRRRNCDELRAVKSRAMTQAVTAARAAQVTERHDRITKEKEENKALDAAWEASRLKLVAKDEADRARRRKADMEQARAFEEQVRQLQEAKAKEHAAEAAYSAMVRQQAEVERVKDEHAAQIKALESRRARQELETVNRERAAQRAREVREALEQDLAWIQSLLDLDQADKEAETERKAQLRKELLEFRDTVLAQRAAEVARVVELDRIFAADAERVWRAKTAKWAAEHAARSKLMADVIKSRQEQLAIKAERAKQKLAEKRTEREQLEFAVAEAKRMDELRRERERRARIEYHAVLQAQVADKQARRAVAMEQERGELDKQRAADQEYEQWLERELARSSVPLSMRGGASM
ncbi:tumor suppressor, Mitostatin-domain-containing protein [Catenaria anguillulae PL171]|uniref:Cilia- and flagella-associated protein 53 n=1 Tax=Catenaria anguillulae PL171 TaxID=765915 RepID=A0A1Y2H7R8_9FUNG|nr:tumor suppressor, Mitostatin-domain-containing protein [Catenaria anguillulae PL171]